MTEESTPAAARGRWLRLVLGAATAFSWLVVWSLAKHQSGEGTVFGRYSPRYAALVAGAAAVALLATIAHLEPIYRRLHARRLQLLTIAVTLTASLLLAEAVVRLLDPAGISYYEYISRTSHRIPDAELLYRLRPDHTWRANVEYRTNSLGFRDRPIGPPETGGLRILALGDSLTFGQGVAEEDTFVRRLETLLGQERPGVRVINAGVSGYNSVQEQKLLERYAATIEPDVVLLEYHQNDIDHRVPLHEAEATSSGERPSRLTTLKSLVWRSWLWRLAVHRIRFAQPMVRPVDRDGEGWLGSMNAVERLSEYCADHGYAFAVVYFRWRPSPLNDALLHDLRAIAARRGFPIADTLAWYDGRDIDRLYNSQVDSHPNAEGHAILAEGIARFLGDEGLLEH